ncbi:MAG: PDZ domain-containing protein [Anaerolineae bacterium]|nr:MAG: PDZ domain-containing protein [Anaerolineae bacterium]
MSVFKDLSNAMAEAVETAGKATVLVNGRQRMPASGIAYARDYVLTANHVVERDEDIRVTLPDGMEAAASIAGRDPGSDLALLKLEKGGLTPAETGAAARVGQMVLALGRPSGEGVQASLGVVSALHGPARTARGGMLEQFIRTDAIPYPGFSGGPLVDAEGKVVGINTSGLGGGNSIAIPAALAWKVAAELKEHGSVKRGYIGVRSQLVDLPNAAKKTLGREQAQGLLVMGMEDGSPAETAGLMIGDILIGFNGQPVHDHEDLLAALTGAVVGKATPLEILRGGKVETVQITAAERKEEAPRREHRRHAMWEGRMPRGFGRRFGRHMPRHFGPRNNDE